MLNAKKVGTFIVLTSGIGLIFELAYIRNSFYIPMCIALNLTNEQFGVLSSIYSLVAAITYIIFGFIADRIESRIVLFLPFAFTGILGFMFSSFPEYSQLKVIFALMGITTIMTYFSFTIRLFRMFGRSLGQGRIFGFMESGKGIAGGTVFVLMLLLFNSLGGGEFGFKWIIRAYSIINFILGIGVLLLVPDEYIKSKTTLSIKEQISLILFNKQIWLFSITVFIAYSLYAMLSFLPSFFVEVFNVSVNKSSLFSLFRYTIQIFAPISLGIASDKIKSSYKIIFISLILCLLSSVIFIKTIGNSSFVFVAIFNYFLVAFVIYGMKALYYSGISETGVDFSLTGSAMGVIGCIGFSSDLFSHQMIGSWIDEGVSGYNKMLVYMMVLCIIGIGAVLRAIKKQRLQKKW